MLDLPRLGMEPESPFPPPAEALDSPNGLLAWGGDLHPARLLNAYAHGIFPWYSDGQPILWWSPAPRCVIFPADVYLSRRTMRRYNSGVFSLTADTAFEQVIAQCAEPREDEEGTWITDEMMHAYIDLHRHGFAHSIEVWEESCLVGGIYGLALGDVFFGESMFSRRSDASKIALVGLCRELLKRSMKLLDCQVANPHLLRMGAVEISRPDFTSYLPGSSGEIQPGRSWSNSYSAEPRWSR